jgi:hypothetical protein
MFRSRGKIGFERIEDCWEEKLECMIVGGMNVRGYYRRLTVQALT